MASPVHWHIEGTSRNKSTGLRNVYTVTLYPTGRWACSCPAHKFQPEPREDCQHILKVKLNRGDGGNNVPSLVTKILTPEVHRVFKEII